MTDVNVDFLLQDDEPIRADFEVEQDNTLVANISVEGSNDHNVLINRGMDNQHPISAITDLQDTLDTLHGEIGELGQTIGTYGDIVTHNTDEFATAEQGALADTALQPGDNISELVNDSDYATENYVDNGLSAKQDVISDLSAIREGASLGATAVQRVETGNSNGAIRVDGRDVAVKGLESAAYTPSSDYATSAQGSLADTALQPNDDISELNNDVGYITSASLPTVNNGTLTIQKNGSSVGTFTANQATNTTVNVVVPTQASDIGALPDTTTIADLTTTAQLNALNSGATTTNIGQITTNENDITSINDKIPSQASSSNQLADKNFVNSSIATNTANFIGTFNSVADLEAYSGTLTNNDYAFVQTTDSAGNTLYDRYKWNGSAWLFEYELNNSSFTAEQWATINSGATSSDVALAQSALQSGDNVSELVNDAGYITGIDSSDVTTALGYTPADDTNVVHKTGTETIGGNKTFSNDVTFNNPVTLNQTTTFNTGASQFYNGGYRMWKYKMASGNTYEDMTFLDNSGTFLGSFRVDNTGMGEFISFTSIQAPTPTADNTTSKQIDTVGARNTKLADYATTASLASYALDSDVVKLTGNQTISGTKSFNASLTRTSTIDPSTTTGETDVRTLSTVTNNGSTVIASYNATRSGTLFSNRQRVANPNINGWYDIRVVVADNGQGYVNTACSSSVTNLSMTQVTSSTSTAYIPTMGWVNNPSTSTNVVHRSGNETIGGDKTFTGKIKGDNSVEWGGISLSGDVSPSDAGCIDDFGHNKASFWGGDITAEYTTDGSTWTDYGLSSWDKWAIVTKGGADVIVGKNTLRANAGTLTDSNVADVRARITLSTLNSSNVSKFYSKLKKILLEVSTAGASNCKVQISSRTKANHLNNVDTWTVIGTYNVSGWSGWNSIPFDKTVGGYDNQSPTIADLRFEFWSETVNSSNESTLRLKSIRLLGLTNWIVDDVAKDGHLYTYDNNKSVTFPASVSFQTQNTNDNSTKGATTAYVKNNLADYVTTNTWQELSNGKQWTTSAAVPIALKGTNQSIASPQSTSYCGVRFVDSANTILGNLRSYTATWGVGINLDLGAWAGDGYISITGDYANTTSKFEVGTTTTKVTAPTEDNTTSTQIDTVGARNTKLGSMFQVVASLPATPDPDTFYFIEES